MNAAYTAVRGDPRQRSQVINVEVSVPETTGSCTRILKAKNIWKIKNLLLLMILKFLICSPLNLVIHNSNLKIHEWNILSYSSCCYSSLCIPQVKLYFLAKFKPNCIISLRFFLSRRNQRLLLKIKKLFLTVGLLTLPTSKLFSSINPFLGKHICVFHIN